MPVSEQIVVINQTQEQVVIIPEGTETVYPIVQETINTANLISQADKDKLDALSVSADRNVQPDWNEIDTNSWAYIKNKPDINQEVMQNIQYLTIAVNAHLEDLNNPHQTELMQLKDVIINELKDGNLVGFNESTQQWNNIKQTMITDGGNF